MVRREQLPEWRVAPLRFRCALANPPCHWGFWRCPVPRPLDPKGSAFLVLSYPSRRPVMFFRRYKHRLDRYELSCGQIT